MTRRKNDFYPTLDTNAIEYLMKYWDIPKFSDVFECCAGEGHLLDQLKPYGFNWLRGGDIAGSYAMNGHEFDATDQYSWEVMSVGYTITNPPFKDIMNILPLAWEYSRLGIAMLLPLNFLEPCHNRYQWLVDHPISKIIAIPRISFTGDGKNAPIATAWFVWDKQSTIQEIIVTR